MYSLIDQLYKNSKDDKLVERKVAFQTNELDLYLYETKIEAFDYPLEFNEVSLISMISGKKNMKIDGKEFIFETKESLILDKNVPMEIDFPEATISNPTKCLAIVFSPEELSETITMLNEKYPKLENELWYYDFSNIKFENDEFLKQNLNKIITLASTNSEYKNILSSLISKELIINLLQTKARNLLIKNSKQLSTDYALAAAVEFIKNNAHQNLTLEFIAEKIKISRSTLHRHFKRELGITPNEFILEEKIKKAKFLLRNTQDSVSEIAYNLSFGSSSQFIKHFKKLTGITPLKYKKNI